MGSILPIDYIQRYDNPSRAMVIWSSYFPEAQRIGVHSDALNLLGSCRKCWDLDLELDKLISGLDVDNVPDSSRDSLEEVSTGLWNNALRAFEEGRTI